MKNMSLRQIAEACQGQLVLRDGSNCEEADQEVDSVVLDSRLAGEGSLFMATKGERVDGHDFIPEVFQKGALAVICEKRPREIGNYILVDNTLRALAMLATYYRQQLAVRVIGISGSVGKTSTKECVATVLSQHYNVLRTEGNLNNEVGLPLTILRMRQEHEVAVLEMGISDFGEMTRLSQMAQPDLCLLTNIGQCHLEQLGTRQGILRAKTEMFASMKPGGSICLNADDDLLALAEPYEGASMYYFGSVPPAHGKMPQVYATDIESHGLKGSSCKIHTPGGIIDAQIPLPGEHMVHNALAAALVAGLLGLSGEEIAKGLASQVAVSGRSNCLETDKYVIIDDCYNANPVSMKSALDLLALAKGRKVAILGDMYELGANSESLHNEVGSYAASRAELLICVGELSAGIAEGARKMGMQRVMTFATKEEALERFGGILRQGDTILIKASHGMHLEKLVESLTKL